MIYDTSGRGHYDKVISNYKFAPQVYHYKGVHDRTYVLWMNKTNMEKMVFYIDNDTGEISESFSAGYGTAGDTNSNNHGAIIVANDGHIIVAYTKGVASYAHPLIMRSNNAEDISSFSLVKEITSGYNCPKLVKLNGTLFLILIGNVGITVKICKSLDNGLTWDAEKSIAYIGSSYLVYPSIITNNDSIYLVINQYKDYYEKVFFLKSSDGITFSNVNETFSKNIVNNGYITGTEIQNCLVGQSPGSSINVYADYGYKSPDGTIFLSYRTWKTSPATESHYYLAFWSGTEWVKREITGILDSTKKESDRQNIWGMYAFSDTKIDIFLTTDVNGITEIQQWRTLDQGLNWVKIADLTSESTYNHFYSALTFNSFDTKKLHLASSFLNGGTDYADIRLLEIDYALGAVGTLAAERISNQVNLTLEPVTNAIIYKIYRNDVEIYSGEELTFQDEITPGIYTYKYMAVGEEEETDYSEPVVIDFLLGEIGTLAVERIGNKVNLTLEAVKNAISYKIYRNDSEIYSGTELTFQDEIEPGVYAYKYMAIGDIEETDYSEPVVIDFLLGEIGTLAAERIGNHVNLTLEAVKNAISYKIYRNDSEIYSGTELTFQDEIEPGVYAYKYMAIGDIEETGYSEPVTIIYGIGKIGTLTAERIGNKVNLTLEPVINATIYKIYRNEVEIYSGDDLTYQDEITPGTYTYKYMAIGEEESTDYSEPVIIGYGLGAVGKLSALRLGNQVILTLEPVENAISYKIYRDDIEIYSGAELKFKDEIIPGTYTYEYMAVGDGEETDYSAPVTVEWTWRGAMKEFKIALKEVLIAAQGEGKPLESVNRIEKTGNFAPDKADFDLIYFQEPVDRHLAGDNHCRAIESSLSVHCVVLSDINDRETYEEKVEDLVWKVIDVVLANPTLICTSYPEGLCKNAQAFTKIGDIIYGQGTLAKNQMPVEIASFGVTVRYQIRN